MSSGAKPPGFEGGQWQPHHAGLGAFKQGEDPDPLEGLPPPAKTGGCLNSALLLVVIPIVLLVHQFLL